MKNITSLICLVLGLFLVLVLMPSVEAQWGYGFPGIGVGGWGRYGRFGGWGMPIRPMGFGGMMGPFGGGFGRFGGWGFRGGYGGFRGPFGGGFWG